MNRTIQFDDNLICDVCGHKGAYDFMGDYLCDECVSKAFNKCSCRKDCDCNNIDYNDANDNNIDDVNK